MLKSWFTIVFILFYSCITGCGGREGSGRAGHPAAPETSDTTFVDATTGNDATGDGTREKPYQTISHTLLLTSTKSIIKIAHGIYDISIGEQFPIVIPAGKSLTADPIDLDADSAALIRGSGEFDSEYVNGVNTVAVVFDDADSLKNVVIEATDGIALWVERATINSEIVKSGLYASQVGLTLVNDASPQIIGNVMQKNQLNGIELIGNVSPIFLNNSIKENNIGIVITDSASPKFGNSSGGGNNSITNNTLCDFRHTGKSDMNTVGTLWDQDIFEFTITNSCTGGANIVVDGIGFVDYQFIPSTNSLLFQSQQRIRMDQPLYGEVILSQVPSFEWASSGAHLTMVMIWSQPPVVGLSEITSTENIYWLWHSGLGTGGTGYAQFDDGRSLQGDDITNTSPPQPFEKGRSYYWAVWEWDADGKEIYASSSLNYFRVSN